MFLYILGVVVAGAAVHTALLKERTRERMGEIALLWVLVGYCGVPMLVVSAISLHHSHLVADWLGFPPHNPFQTFLSVAYLGMSLVALLALRYRGTYLIGPAVVWATFFAGATLIHLGHPHGGGPHEGGHGGVLAIFATHGLISVLLVAGLVASGVLRRRGDAARDAP